MKALFFATVAIFYLSLAGCASVTVEKKFSYGSSPLAEEREVGEDEIEPLSFKKREAVIEMLMSLKKGESGLICSGDKTAKNEIKKEGMLDVWGAFYDVSNVLDREMSGDPGKVVINKKLRKKAMDSVGLYQSGKLKVFSELGREFIEYIEDYNGSEDESVLACLEGNGLERADLDQAMMAVGWSNFLYEYLRAYFRGGRFAFAKLDADGISGKLSESVVDGFKNEISYDALDEEKKSLVDNLIDKVKASIGEEIQSVCKTSDQSGCLLTTALGEDALITKGGRSIQFAGVGILIGEEGKASLSLDKPESTDVAAQLIEVVVESFMDSQNRNIPALANSTACASHLIDASFCKPEAEFQKSFEEIYEKGDAAAGYATSLASMIVRGGYFWSLDNEAIAKAIETGAGSVARKMMEVSASKYIGKKSPPEYMAFSVE